MTVCDVCREGPERHRCEVMWTDGDEPRTRNLIAVVRICNDCARRLGRLLTRRVIPNLEGLEERVRYEEQAQAAAGFRDLKRNGYVDGMEKALRIVQGVDKL